MQLQKSSSAYTDSLVELTSFTWKVEQTEQRNLCQDFDEGCRLSINPGCPFRDIVFYNYANWSRGRYSVDLTLLIINWNNRRIQTPTIEGGFTIRVHTFRGTTGQTSQLWNVKVVGYCSSMSSRTNPFVQSHNSHCIFARVMASCSFLNFVPAHMKSFNKTYLIYVVDATK